jgi:phosphatidate phosphatase APP1
VRCGARRGLAAAGVAALLVAAGPALARDETQILVHYAYGTAQRFTLEGRVVERHDGRPVRGGDSWLTNLWRSVRSLRAEEQPRVPVRVTFAAQSWTAVSDAEGYFSLSARTPPRALPGWNPLLAESGDGAARTATALLLVPAADTLGLISDFDDTVIVSEVPDRSRLASHTLLENHLQRLPVVGMAELYRRVLARNPDPGRAPAIYLTGSPRQLQPGIAAFLERTGFPRGPIIAKKVSDGGGGDPLLDQERYKVDRIESVLENLPDVRFVLVGDDGERDPEVYDAIRTRHPSRVEAVYIRRVSADPARPRYPGQGPPPIPVP